MHRGRLSRRHHVGDALAAPGSGAHDGDARRCDVAFVAGRQPGREHLGVRPQARAGSADSLPFTGSAGGDRLDGARRADIGTWRSCCSTGVPLWCSSCCPAGRRGAEAQRRRGATISSAPVRLRPGGLRLSAGGPARCLVPPSVRHPDVGQVLVEHPVPRARGPPASRRSSPSVSPVGAAPGARFTRLRHLWSPLLPR